MDVKFKAVGDGGVLSVDDGTRTYSVSLAPCARSLPGDRHKAVMGYRITGTDPAWTYAGDDPGLAMDAAASAILAILKDEADLNGFDAHIKTQNGVRTLYMSFIVPRDYANLIYVYELRGDGSRKSARFSSKLRHSLSSLFSESSLKLHGPYAVAMTEALFRTVEDYLDSRSVPF